MTFVVHVRDEQSGAWAVTQYQINYETNTKDAYALINCIMQC